ncbi:hypothetical protein SAMN05421841_0643 [Chryseobacterium wanjuense]|uniref:Uncharacterized protein n=1 Tax=Chryseobacterium wanjuense TaxID=356305 RepID=A0A1I0NKB7_9FLAO|nr:hypothetical protein [Chryseobacterium wanjuense]SEW01759.1 hypothetical protein SAMN05421841_0643 [Chryseobacterium wanjuense]
MKKQLLIIFALILGITINAQIGINTPFPVSTLYINAKNPTGTSTNVDGLVIPRVDRQRAQSMVGIVVSTMIYVNNAATGSQAGNAVNIDTVGFYYFDGNVWQKFITTATTQKIFAYIGKNQAQLMQQGDIVWQTKTGVNADLISVSGSNITLPPNKTFLLHGNVSWLYSSTVPDGEAWMRFHFLDATTGNRVGVVNITGYQEASTESVKDAGISLATSVIQTGNTPVTVKLTTFGPSYTYGLFPNDPLGKTPATYILIQEL